ncbi:MAG: ABC transporter permease [Chloroflexi bacterium]|nr:ABC transporter permease [Anaerolineaceae bacterium]NMB89594.1 ABC transporter permease [Chloroflexota bacterium]
MLIFRAFRQDPLAIAGLVIIFVFIFCSIFAPLLTPYAAQGLGDPDIVSKFQAPSAQHPLGTDYLGRDVLARIFFGGRSSLGTGLLVVVIAVIIGTPLGAIAGYYGGWIDELIMRITDMFLAFPPLLLALAIAAALGPGFANTMIAIAITWWPWYTRLVRAQTISLRERYFIEAARSIGVPDLTIIRTHILPNVLTPVLVQSTMDLGSAILTGAALNFIGLGIRPPMADWGNMISQGRIYFIERPWFAGSAGAAIFLVTLAFNLVGDALRDASDPKTRRGAE